MLEESSLQQAATNLEEVQEAVDKEEVEEATEEGEEAAIADEEERLRVESKLSAKDWPPRLIRAAIDLATKDFAAKDKMADAYAAKMASTAPGFYDFVNGSHQYHGYYLYSLLNAKLDRSIGKLRKPQTTSAEQAQEDEDIAAALNSLTLAGPSSSSSTRATSSSSSSSGSRSIQCPHCTSKFSSEESLTSHLESKAGEGTHPQQLKYDDKYKDYLECKYCNKWFNGETALGSHMYSSLGSRGHPATWEKVNEDWAADHPGEAAPGSETKAAPVTASGEVQVGLPGIPDE